MSGRERSQGQKERWSIGDDRGWRLCGEDAEEGSRRRGPAGDGGGERGRVTKEERRGGGGGRSKDEDESCWGGSTGAADEEKEGGGRSTKEEGGGGGLSVRLEGQVGEDGVSEGGGERGIAIVRRREGAPPGRRETHRRPPLHAEEDRRSTHGIGRRADHTLDLTSVIRPGMVGKCNRLLSIWSVWCKDVARHSSLIGSLRSLRYRGGQVSALPPQPRPAQVRSWDLSAVMDC
ncbi:hypothetical protein BHM03_00056553 [Ensete ventricosum]|nr:hypothetical protein BHM03_00056553 [Ensete ventricosum]